MSWFIVVCFLLLLCCLNQCKESTHNSSAVLFNLDRLDVERPDLHDLQELTTDLLPRMSKRAHCVAIICDFTHAAIFTGDVFKAYSGKVSYFLVVVKDSEDLLSPNYQTVESIRQIRRDGCQSFLILLSNAIQTTRLLRFGDRHRELDTRARFAMLHDFRLFAPSLHYLWSRIVNVVFLRRFRTRGDDPITWFEVSTVPFPARVRSVFIPKRLDWWRVDGFRNGVHLFRDKAKDLSGQILKVVVLPHTPAVLKLKITRELDGNLGTTEVHEYKGLEIELLKALAVAMNFTMDMYEPKDSDLEQWGRRLFNGTFTGLLGEMVGGYADFALGDLHYTPYYLKHMDLSIPYGSECLTFLTPEALYDNSWMTLILPFQPYMWAAVFVALFFGGFIFYGLARYQEHLSLSPSVGDETRITAWNIQEVQATGLHIFGHLTNAILYTWGMLLVVSLPKLSTGWSLRMLTGWYWIYCVLVVCSYRASMTAILANPVPRVSIDTLEQLSISPIPCGGWGEQSRDFFLTSLDVASQKVGAKFETVDRVEDGVNRVASGEFAYYGNRHFLHQAFVERQKYNVKNNRSDKNRLHIMEVCAINMPISIGLQKNSPIKKRADSFLRRVIESGLSDKWLGDIIRPVLAAEIVDEPQEALMDLSKLYGALIALGVGSVVSILALSGEIFYWNCVTQRKPDFDKYALREYYTKTKM